METHMSSCHLCSVVVGRGIVWCLIDGPHQQLQGIYQVPLLSCTYCSGRLPSALHQSTPPPSPHLLPSHSPPHPARGGIRQEITLAQYMVSGLGMSWLSVLPLASRSVTGFSGLKIASKTCSSLVLLLTVVVDISIFMLL